MQHLSPLMVASTFNLITPTGGGDQPPCLSIRVEEEKGSSPLWDYPYKKEKRIPLHLCKTTEIIFSALSCVFPWRREFLNLQIYSATIAAQIWEEATSWVKIGSNPTGSRMAPTKSRIELQELLPSHLIFQGVANQIVLAKWQQKNRCTLSSTSQLQTEVNKRLVWH